MFVTAQLLHAANEHHVTNLFGPMPFALTRLPILVVMLPALALPLAPAAVAQEVTIRQAKPSDDGQRVIIHCGRPFNATSEPLFVIDGVVAPVPGNLSHIMPEDIVSIEILRGDTALDFYGHAANAGVVIITTRQGLMVQEQTSSRLATLGVYPNPASHRATLSFSVAEQSQVSVTLFDVSGRRVLQVEPRMVEAGSRHEVILETSGLASGTYLYRLEVGGAVSSGRLTVAR